MRCVKAAFVAAAIVLTVVFTSSPVLAEPASGEWKTPKAAGPCGVEVITYDWLDAPRNRQVPVKLYYPKTSPGPCPVIVFSHGLGGSRDGYEYLGRHWAEQGQVAIHVTHPGSNGVALSRHLHHVPPSELPFAYAIVRSSWPDSLAPLDAELQATA